MSEFLWHERARPTRGPKPALTLDGIADAAIAVADAEGLEAVSMQRVAAELGKTKMALYRYLPGKTELVAAMLERGLGEPPDLGRHEDVPSMRQALTVWATALLARFTSHPWAIEASTGSRPIGPNELGWMDRALAVLPGTLTGAERLDLIATLAGHVRGLAAQGNEAGLTGAMSLVLREHADRFPAVVAAVTDVTERGGADDAFHFGLARILDGLATLLTARTRTGVKEIREG